MINMSKFSLYLAGVVVVVSLAVFVAMLGVRVHASDIVSPPEGRFVIRALDSVYRCQRIDVEKQIAYDCKRRNPSTELSEIHLSIYDMWSISK